VPPLWKRNLQTAPTRQQLSSKIFLCGKAILKRINKNNLQKLPTMIQLLRIHQISFSDPENISVTSFEGST